MPEPYSTVRWLQVATKRTHTKSLRNPKKNHVLDPLPSDENTLRINLIRATAPDHGLSGGERMRKGQTDQDHDHDPVTDTKVKDCLAASNQALGMGTQAGVLKKHMCRKCPFLLKLIKKQLRR
eukprot:m.34824 g.34824  ORF g.34824 m.34824 type:complete len:123 (+) comp32025_c0_seq1:427-795(+)